MLTLHIERPVKLPIDKHILLKAAQMTLAAQGLSSEVDLSIVVGDDTLLRKLNLQYRQVDAATDVLSFPSSELDPDTSHLNLGDVVISLPRAEQQAAAGPHPVADELQLLVVHGTLHLLGYDHVKALDKKKMQTIQDKIMQELGVNIAIRL